LLDDSIERFIDRKDYAYNFTYFGLTLPLKSRRLISINGHFSGSNKSNDIRNLFKHCNTNKLQKFFFSDDKFYIVIPMNPKKTNSGGRPNHVDYVANLISPFGILFGLTIKSGSKTSSEENEGDAFTPIEKIVTTGISSGNTYTFKDKDGNGLTFTASSSGTVEIYLIKMIDLGNDSFFTDFNVAFIGSEKQVLKIATAGKSFVLGLDPGEDLDTRFNSGSASIPSNTTFNFRDGFNAE